MGAPVGPQPTGLLSTLAGRVSATEDARKQKKMEALFTEINDKLGIINNPVIRAIAADPTNPQQADAQKAIDNATFDAHALEMKYGGPEVKEHRGFLSKVFHGLGRGVADVLGIVGPTGIPQTPVSGPGQPATPANLALTTPMPGLAQRFSVPGATPISPITTGAAPGGPATPATLAPGGGRFAPAGAGAAPPPAGLSPRLAYSPQAVGRPVGGLFPIPAGALAQARLSNMVLGPEFVRYRNQLSEAVKMGILTQDQANENLAKFLSPTTTPTGATGTEQTRYYQWPDGHTEMLRWNSRTNDFLDSYNQSRTGAQLLAEGAKEISKPGTAKVVSIPNVPASAPIIQEWARTHPDFKPGNGTYRIFVVNDPETQEQKLAAAPVPQETNLGRRLGQLQQAARDVYEVKDAKTGQWRAPTEEEWRRFGSQMVINEENAKINRQLQNIGVTGFLTGIEPTQGVMLTPQQAGANIRLRSGTQPIQVDQPLPGGEEGSDVGGAPAAAAAPGAPLTPTGAATGQPSQLPQIPTIGAQGVPAYTPTPAPAAAAEPPVTTITPPQLPSAPSVPAAPAAPAAPPAPQTPPAAAGEPPVTTITPPQLPTGTPNAAQGPGILPGGRRLTAQEQGFVTQFLNGKDIKPTVGSIKGQQLLSAPPPQGAGIDAITSRDLYLADSKAFELAQTQKDAMTRFISQLDLFGEQFLKQASQLSPLLGPEITRGPLSDLIKKVHGSPKLRQYEASAQALQRAYTTLVSGAYQSRAQLPQWGADAANKVVDPNITFQEAVALLQQLKREGKVELRSFDEQVHGIQSNLANNPIGKILGIQPWPPLPPIETTPNVPKGTRRNVQGVEYIFDGTSWKRVKK